MRNLLVYKFILIIILSVFSFDTFAQGVDPTKPLSISNNAGVENIKKGLVLETIFYRSKNKSAIISGKLMKVGDYIGEHELITVNSSNVILRSDDERLKLSMFSNVVTK